MKHTRAWVEFHLPHYNAYQVSHKYDGDTEITLLEIITYYNFECRGADGKVLFNFKEPIQTERKDASEFTTPQIDEWMGNHGFYEVSDDL